MRCQRVATGGPGSCLLMKDVATPQAPLGPADLHLDQEAALRWSKAPRLQGPLHVVRLELWRTVGTQKSL